jgi:hypothetical protein
MQAVEVALPTLRPNQQVILDSEAKFKVLCCGRRFGKNVTAMEATLPALTLNHSIAWGSPNYKLFLAAWNQLCGMYRGIAKVNKQEKTLTFPGGGVIEGWSLDVDDPGRGRYYNRWIVDEGGAVPNLMKLLNECIVPTLSDFDGDLLILGTPKVVCPDFITLYRRGLDGVNGWASFSGKTEDNPLIPRAFLEQQKLILPEWQYKQEYEGIPAGVLTGFFPYEAVQAHREAYVRPPTFTGHIRMRGSDRIDHELILGDQRYKDVYFDPDPYGPWKFWGPMVNGRPDQQRAYVCGWDVSAGVGSSNTVGWIIDGDTGEQYGEYVSPRVLPEVASRIAAATGIWLGGRNGVAKVNVEVNGGQGVVFMQALHAIKYPRIAQRRINGTGRDRNSTKPDYGWFSTADEKERILSQLRRAIVDGTIQIHSDRTLDECLMYQINPKNGRLEPILEGEAAEEARIPHGDRAMAAAIALDAAKHEPGVKLPPVVMPREKFFKDIQAGKKPTTGYDGGKLAR